MADDTRIDDLLNRAHRDDYGRMELLRLKDELAAEVERLRAEVDRYKAVLNIAEDAIAYIDTFKHTRPDRGKVASEFGERLAAVCTRQDRETGT